MIIKKDGCRLCFEKPIEVLTASEPAEVRDVLKMCFEHSRRGKFAAGFVCYEAASGLDSANTVIMPEKNGLPLVWFGIFDEVSKTDLPAHQSAQRVYLDWQPETSKTAYRKGIDAIKEYIRSGNTYQVNYTTRLKAAFDADAFDFFVSIAEDCRAGYCAFIETDDFAVCSFSPELFFELKDGFVVTRPVKGTASRAFTAEGDRLQRQKLFNSQKDRAENVMIVDMLRNDLGKIAYPGSVCVSKLFEIEKYPTLYQMSSTITARTDFTADEVFSHLFPCASITGAPKCRTMGIIAELEDSPRGVYTGSIGYFAPDNSAYFNVAIRTVSVDKVAREAVYGVGGAIVWDSTAEGEYDECITKTAFLSCQSRRSDDFKLLESLLWTKDNGFYLLELHLERLKDSAEYFDFEFDASGIVNSLERAIACCKAESCKVRLLLAKDGKAVVEVQPLGGSDGEVKFAVASEAIDSSDVFLYHKTTRRDVYKNAFSGISGCEEVLLFNERGEITEGSFHNAVFEADGVLYTPPVSSGLLAGVMRRHLLEEGRLVEKVITLCDIDDYDNIYLINSVRGFRKALRVRGG